jgi:MYXO-CTERM domain-containing protein
VDNASSLPNSGTIRIDSEFIAYTGKSGNQLTGLTRGANGTTAAPHSANAPVTLVVPATPTMTPRPTPPPHRTQTPPQGLLIQAVGEGGGCATAPDGSSWPFAVLTGAIALLVVRRRSGAA